MGIIRPCERCDTPTEESVALVTDPDGRVQDYSLCETCIDVVFEVVAKEMAAGKAEADALQVGFNH